MTGTLGSFTRYAAGVLILMSASVSTFGQAVKERELKPAFDFRVIQSPVEILSIKLNGEEVEPGKKIKAGDDWLRGVAFKLKNVSDKPIAYVALTLQFYYPEAATRPERVVGYFLSYGLDITSSRHPLPENAPRAIRPGETMDLVLSNEKYLAMLDILSRAGVTANVATARYYVHSAAFEHEPDVVWQQGKLMRRDPDDHNKFNVVGQYSFPD